MDRTTCNMESGKSERFHWLGTNSVAPTTECTVFFSLPAETSVASVGKRRTVIRLFGLPHRNTTLSSTERACVQRKAAGYAQQTLDNASTVNRYGIETRPAQLCLPNNFGIEFHAGQRTTESARSAAVICFEFRPRTMGRCCLRVGTADRRALTGQCHRMFAIGKGALV